MVPLIIKPFPDQGGYRDAVSRVFPYSLLVNKGKGLFCSNPLSNHSKKNIVRDELLCSQDAKIYRAPQLVDTAQMHSFPLRKYDRNLI